MPFAPEEPAFQAQVKCASVQRRQLRRRPRRVRETHLKRVHHRGHNLVPEIEQTLDGDLVAFGPENRILVDAEPRHGHGKVVALGRHLAGEHEVGVKTPPDPGEVSALCPRI